MPFKRKTNPEPTLASLPLLHLGASREAFLDYFDNSWALSELLFTSLATDEAWVQRPYHKLRHPMIFYYGHPVSLYVNKLRLAGLLSEPVNAGFELLFETGVDEMRWDELYEKDDVWPTVVQVRSYRNQAHRIIRGIIETHPGLAHGHPPVTPESPLWAMVMAFEHERIHFETSSVLLRELPVEMLRTPQGWPSYIGLKPTSANTPIPGKDYPVHILLDVQAQTVHIGKKTDFPSFGWDNEYGSEERAVSAFRASDQLITNGEFYAFVVEGGYHDPSFWSHEGWAWRGFRNSKWPGFWVSTGPAGLHQYALRLCFEVVPMQWDWPALVNYHEAKAYAAWKSRRDDVAIPYRLPTEAEHHAMRSALATDPVMAMEAAALPFNLNFASGSECSVTAFPANEKGFRDVFGNVWQWMEDHFHPLPGSKVHPLYADFSEPCYDGEHQMILGGSFISTGAEASRYARFHFRPHFFQHVGFRLCQSVSGAPSGRPKTLRRKNSSAYDTESMLDAYMLMHWGSAQEIFDAELFPELPPVENLPTATAALVKHHAAHFGRALDIGCAVGRSSFEMARDFGEVIGLDYSDVFVSAAQKIQRGGRLGYFRKDQGDQGTHLIAAPDAAIDRERLTFLQGDACDLPASLGSFDAVLLANLLCRLRDPSLCLKRLQGKNALVAKGGVAVMTTPFSWLEEYTPRHAWLHDKEAIGAILSEFELIATRPLPFMIREHRRKFEYIVAEATVWRRR